jgi:inner membrane protein
VEAFVALQGISPWWWVALAILLAAIEMMTVTTVLIWSSLAALLTGLALWVAPALGGAQQIACFAVMSIVFTFAGRALVTRFGLPGDDAAGRLNRRAEQLVGREAVVASFAYGEGQVIVDGTPWPARIAEGTATPAAGARVRVTAADGIVVWVTPV